jgi:hypothetical protein
MKKQSIKKQPANNPGTNLGVDPTPLQVNPPPIRRPTCSDVAKRQNEILSRKCSNKVNLLSCRCSGCDTDDKYPVIVAASDAPLLNTAYNGSGGFLPNSTTGNPVRDLHWEVGIGDNTGNPASVPSSGTGSWIPAYVFGPSSTFTSWIASPFNNANWISYFADAAHPTTGDFAGNLDVYFRYRFNLGASVNPATFALEMDFYADNQVAEIYVNGVAQSPSNPTVLPQQGNIPATDSYSTSGFGNNCEVRITLKKDWQRCDNEIIVYVKSSPGYLGFLAQNTVEVDPEENPCDCHCDCVAVEFPDIHPCISVTWGDSACDCIETDDVEVACVKVCNCYSNVTFSELSIAQILVTDLAGNPVPNLPDGTPSVEVLPSGPICFGDVPPCKGDNQPSCVSRELVIYTRGAIGKSYRLVFRAICFKVCHQFQSDQCFILTLCQD